MKFTGDFKWAGNYKTGQSEGKDPWQRMEFVLENNDGRYPQAALFCVWGSKAADLKEKVAQTGPFKGKWTASFDLRARQFTNKDGVEQWYNELECYDVTPSEPLL